MSIYGSLGMSGQFNVHWELGVDDDLDMVFNWREARRVSKSLTVQYDKVLYLIEDSELSRRAIGKYIDVWHYPDGHREFGVKFGCHRTPNRKR